MTTSAPISDVADTIAIAIGLIWVGSTQWTVVADATEAIGITIGLVRIGGVGTVIVFIGNAVSVPIGDCVAGIDGAIDPIVAVGRRPGLTAVERVTGLRPIAEDGVVAQGVIGIVVARIGCLVAGIDGAVHVVIAVHGRTGLAILDRVASLSAVAENVVVAEDIIGDVVAGVGGLIAGVSRAAHGVVAIDVRTGLARAGRQVAGFVSVTELTIVAFSVVAAI